MSRPALLRPLAIAAGALGLFGGAYLLTAVVLPDPPLSRAVKADPAEIPVPRIGDGGDGIGPSEDVSFQIYDADTGLPVAKVTIGTYRRTSDTVVELGDVVVGAAVQGNAAVTLHSPGGTVRVDPPVAGREQQVDADALAAADQARLSDVTLRWYADAGDLAAGRDATFTARVDNVVFDGSRLTLETGETEIDGEVVLGDDVPVEVRGEDLDFDGYGLQVEWDADAGRPQLVRISRAGRLVLKKPPEFLPPGLLPGDGREASLPARGEAFAQAGGVPADAAPPEAEPEDVTPYRLRLGGPVRADQGDVRLLEAAAVGALLPLRAGAALSGSNTSLDDVEPDEPEPSSRRPSNGRNRPSRPAAATFEPVIVTWPGEAALVVADGEQLAGPDDARLSLAGDEWTPFMARLNDGNVVANRLDYAQAADELVLSSGETVEQVELADAEGSVVRGPKLVAQPNAGTARIVGAGTASVVAGEGRTSQLAWTDACDFAFDEDAGGGRSLRHVDAAGQVRVTAEDLDLASDRLGLTLDDVDGERALTAADALGSVVATLPDESGKPTTVTADRLFVRSPEGPDGPTELEADGGVEAVRPDGVLSGERLVARLADAGDGPALQNLRVERNVVLVDAEGQVIRGDVATVAGENEPVVIVGSDETGPVTVDVELAASEDREAQRARLTSPTVVLDPADESLAVPTPGELVSVSAEGERTVTWSGSFAATARRIDAVGDVVIDGDAEQDARVRVTAGRAAVLLNDAREPERVEAAAGVSMTAVQEDAASGDVLMSFDLRASELSGDPLTGEVAVPVPGRLLIRDLRPPEQDADTFGGVVAVAWQDRLDYDPVADVVTLTGGVTAAVEPEGKPAFDLQSDTMNARIAREDGGNAASLLGASASGNVRLDAEGATVESDFADYDAAAGTATLTAGDGSSVRIFDPDGRPTGQFQSAVYDVESGQIVRLTELRAAG